MRAGEHSTESSLYRGSERMFGSAHGEPSASDAVERVLDAGQRLVSERIELVKLDVQDAITDKIAQSTTVVVPWLFAFGGWWILMGGLIALLGTYVGLPASLAVVGGAHVLIGGGMATSARRRLRRPVPPRSGIVSGGRS